MAAYGDQPLRFGPDTWIPKPFDPRRSSNCRWRSRRQRWKPGGDAADHRLRRLPREQRHVVYQAPHDNEAGVRAREGRSRKGVVYARARTTAFVRRAGGRRRRTRRPILIGRRERIAERLEQLSLHVKMDED